MSCIKTLRSLGHEAIVIDCNPEAVSIPFDVPHWLDFEELSRAPSNLHQQGIKISGLTSLSGLSSPQSMRPPTFASVQASLLLCGHHACCPEPQCVWVRQMRSWSASYALQQ